MMISTNSFCAWPLIVYLSKRRFSLRFQSAPIILEARHRPFCPKIPAILANFKHTYIISHQKWLTIRGMTLLILVPPSFLAQHAVDFRAGIDFWLLAIKRLAYPQHEEATCSLISMAYSGFDDFSCGVRFSWWFRPTWIGSIMPRPLLKRFWAYFHFERKSTNAFIFEEPNLQPFLIAITLMPHSTSKLDFSFDDERASDFTISWRYLISMAASWPRPSRLPAFLQNKYRFILAVLQLPQFQCSLLFIINDIAERRPIFAKIGF